jgi:hypothetical protein
VLTARPGTEQLNYRVFGLWVIFWHAKTSRHPTDGSRLAEVCGRVGLWLRSPGEGLKVPELFKQAVEDCQLLLPRHKQRPQRPVDAALSHDVHVSNGADRVGGLLWPNKQAMLSQHTTEARQMGDEVVVCYVAVPIHSSEPD